MSDDEAPAGLTIGTRGDPPDACLLYTSDAADDLPCVDPRGRRLIQKKKQHTHLTNLLSE